MRLMKTVRQFALMLAVLLPALAPAMVCALPNAHLSPAERACCKQMEGQCGSMTMPDSHGCCHKEGPTAGPWNAAVQARPASVRIDLAATSKVTPALLLPLPVNLSGQAQWPGRALPQTGPPAISVLRI